MSIFDDYLAQEQANSDVEMSLAEYLELCKNDPMAYAFPAQRMLKAIGTPVKIETRNDPRLSRIYGNKIINQYPAFESFYGMEEVIEQIVAYYTHAAQGLEERKQVLYLLGPVGGGKSSLAERLKQLMEEYPIYAIKDSPVFDNPLNLFNPGEWGERLEKEYGIPPYAYTGLLSPWAIKRKEELGHDISKVRVVRIKLSVLHQRGIAKTEPGDENNQDISALVGKADIHKLGKYSPDDADAYSYSGGLCRGNRGLLEFVEMFKAPIKTLHPLLTATQEGNFKGTEGISAIPFEGLVLAHSNESEWSTFRNNSNNEAFLDRVYIVKVPYCLRFSEETKIYQKLLANSTLRNAPCAPHTLEMLAQFAVLSRLTVPENSNIFTKMRVYDGENLKDSEVTAKSYSEYKSQAGSREGMTGISTRFAYKVLSSVFNYDNEEVAADPVHLIKVLQLRLEREDLMADTLRTYQGYIKEYLIDRYVKALGKEMQQAYLESYSDYGQNLFDRYVTYADHWLQQQEFADPDTNDILDPKTLDAELSKIEKPAGIGNPRDFRNEVVNFVLRARNKNNGNNPSWTSYEKLKEIIERRMFSNTEDLIPIISFTAKTSNAEQEKHRGFVQRMLEKGYTEKQVRRLSDWYIRAQKQS